MPDLMPPFGVAIALGQLLGQNANLLQEQHIRVQPGDMLEKPLAKRGPQAIDIPCDNSHRYAPLSSTASHATISQP